MAVHGTAATAADERTPLLAGQSQETQLTVPVNEEHRDAAAAPSGRQFAPDLLRGLLMVMMAEDHINVMLKGYPHGTSSGSESADRTVTRWTVTLGYVMRTATHLCAPGFTMLLGVGLAFFMASRAQRGWTPAKLSGHVVRRFIALVIVNEVMGLFVLSQHIWVLNMVLLALAFDYLLVGLLAVALATYVEPGLRRVLKRTLSSSTADRAAFHSVNAVLLALSGVTLWWNIWLDPTQGTCPSSPTLATVPSWTDEHNCSSKPTLFLFNFLFRQFSCKGIVSGFPPLAWISFAIFGLLYGRLLLARTVSRRTSSSASSSPPIALEAALTVAFTLLFVATRVFQFGNLTSNSSNCLHTPDQRGNGNPYLASFKSFFYIIKYPPSPAFGFFTMAANFACLVVFTLASSPALTPSKTFVRLMRSDANPLLVFGRQPLFYYAVHMYACMLVGAVVMQTRLVHDVPADEWDGVDPMRGTGLGFTFFAGYAIVLVMMYPLCRVYSRFKMTKPTESVWRFL